jgi:hypothetical protein
MKQEYQIQTLIFNGEWVLYYNCGTDLEPAKLRLAWLHNTIGSHFRLVKATFEVIE